MESVLNYLTPEQRTELAARKGVALTTETHSKILEHCRREKEADTYTSGFIRVYSLKDDPTKYFGEEVDIDTKVVVWRVLSSMDEAERFIKHRLDCYSLMWGSCCAGKFIYDKVWEDS